MTLRNVDYYSERALNERRLANIAAREKSRKIAEALERQCGEVEPKRIRQILGIVAPEKIETPS